MKKLKLEQAVYFYDERENKIVRAVVAECETSKTVCKKPRTIIRTKKYRLFDFDFLKPYSYEIKNKDDYKIFYKTYEEAYLRYQAKIDDRRFKDLKDFLDKKIKERR